MRFRVGAAGPRNSKTSRRVSVTPSMCSHILVAATELGSSSLSFLRHGRLSLLTLSKMTDCTVQILPTGEEVVYQNMRKPRIPTPSAISVALSEDDGMTINYLYATVDKSKETPEGGRNVLNLQEEMKKCMTPSQRSQHPETYTSMVNLFMTALERENQNARESRRARWARRWNHLQNENARALCFWRVLCIILTAGIMVLIVMMRQPVVNTYYTYQ